LGSLNLRLNIFSSAHIQVSTGVESATRNALLWELLLFQRHQTMQ
jgi:hypothetical protein